VGYSCKLLTDDLEDIYVVDGDTMETVEQQLLKARDDMIRRLGINVSPNDKSKLLGLSTQSRIERLLKRAKNNKPAESKSSPTLEMQSSSSDSPFDEMPSIRVTRPSHCRQPSLSSQHSVTADDMPDDFGGFAIIVNGNSLVSAEKLFIFSTWS
jgi:phospholipid-translocating ATPase